MEVTGLDPEKDRIVEIGAVKLNLDGSLIEKRTLINPERPIPPEATAVHHITDEMVKDRPTFARLARALFEFMDGCDLTGYNIRGFDIPLLAAEYRRIKVLWPGANVRIIDAYGIVAKKEPRNLAWARKFYTGEELSNAHSALDDARATLAVVVKQVERYQVRSMDDLKDLSWDPDLVDFQGKFRRKDASIIITFGKHRDHAIETLPRDYLEWFLDQSFMEDAKSIVKAELDRRRSAVQVNAGVPLDNAGAST